MRKLAAGAWALILGNAYLTQPLSPAGVARGDVVFASSTVTGSGGSGYSGFQQSTPVSVSTTTPTTSIITISDTWTAIDNNPVTYRMSAVGGLDPASTPANATFSGRLTLQDDAGGPPPQAAGTVTLSWCEPYFDLVLNTQSTVTATGTITNANSALGGYDVSMAALGIFNTSWNRIESSGFTTTSAATFSQNYQFQTILNPGTVRFSPFANITTNPTWQGNTVTMDWSFTVTAVPEPSTFGLAAIGLAGAGLACRRRKVARRKGCPPAAS